MATVRLCFVGDSLTAGTGDAECRGWPGRAAAAETARGHDVSAYNLGVRGETSTDIAARWEAECRPRLPEYADGRLVFMLGLNDAADMNGAGVRVAQDRSVAAARAILSRAVTWRPALWLGPTPVHAEGATVSPGPGIRYHFDAGRTAALNDAYRSVAATLDVPYLDLHAALATDPAWTRALEAGDGVHPAAEGYALIAARLAEWAPWRAWFG